MLYLLNTLVIPIQDDYAEVVIRRISVEQAREIITNNEFTSAIGHSATATLLSRLLGVDIPAQRIAIYLKPSDKAIAFFLKQRLPEGYVISDVQELENIQYDLYLIERNK